MKVGFIGLGRMGSAMARNLIAAGHELTVWNRSPGKAKPLADAGAHVVEEIREIESDAIFTMLSDDNAAREVYRQLPASSAIQISSSTISIELARELSQRPNYIAAPVFGRPEAAEKKMLVVAAAGKQDLIDRVQPLFEAMGRRTFVVGTEPWQANALKLCGNFMIVSMLEAFSEAFTAVSKTGVERQTFLDVINELFGSPVYKNYGQLMVDRKYEPAGFALKLGLKDVGLMLQFAQQMQSPMPIASLVRDHLVEALAHGQSDIDWSSIELVLARHAGTM